MIRYQGKEHSEVVGTFTYDISKGTNINLLHHVQQRMAEFQMQLPPDYSVVGSKHPGKIVYTVYRSKPITFQDLGSIRDFFSF